MKRILLLIALFFSFSYASGTYDTFYFTDEEEKYSLFFCNTSTATEMTNLGLSASDYTAISGLRPLANVTPAQISDSLFSISDNSNITGDDMKRIREWSYRMDIPDHNDSMTQYNALGIQVFQFNFLMSLIGALIGFAFAFFLIYGILNIGKKA